MTVKSGATWAGAFVTLDATGAKANSSVGPSGTLYVNGVVNSAVVSIVTGTNPYKWSVTLPTLSAGDFVQVYAYANVSSIPTYSFVAEDQADTLLLNEVANNVWNDGLSDNTTTGTAGFALTNVQNVVNNLSLTGAPAYEAASSYVLSTGTQTGGTYQSVDTSNAVYHVHTDNGGLLDLYYEYSLKSDEQAVGIIFKGRMNGTGDNVFVQAYDWTNSVWVSLFTLNGINTTTDTNSSPALVGKYTGTGLNSGKVRIRIVNAVTLSSATLYVDQLIVGKTITNRSVGYQDALIWLDTNGSNTNTVAYIDGVADNPVSTIAAAYTLASSTNLKGIRFLAASNVTLTQSADKWRLVGQARINLGGQSIADAVFRNTYTVSGTSVGDDATFIECGIATSTLYHAYFTDCLLKGTITLIDSNEYFFDKCIDAVSNGTATLIFGSGTNAYLRGYSGGIQINNMQAGSECIIDGAGRVIIDPSCSGGQLTIRGHFPEPTGLAAFLLAGGTYTDNARWAEDQNVYAVTNGYVTTSGTSSSGLAEYMGAIWYDAAAANTNTVVGVDGLPSNPVSDYASVVALIAATGFGVVRVQGTITLSDASLAGLQIAGWHPPVVYDANSTVNYAFAGCLADSKIFGLVIGSLPVDGSAGFITATSCSMSTLANVAGYNILFSDTCPIGDDAYMTACSAEATISTMNFAALTTSFWAVKIKGEYIFSNLTAGTVDFELDGKVTLNASCTGGTVNLYGVCELVDNSAGTTVNDYRTNIPVPVVGTVTNPVTVSGYVNVTGTVVSSSVIGNVGGSVLGTVQSVIDGYVTVSGTVSTTISTPVTVTGYVVVTGTVDANVEKWNTVDVVSNAIPAFAAGSAGGIPTVNASNFIAGIAGTKNQLDDLNDIAAGAQMDLVNAPNALAVTAITTDVFAEVIEGTTSFKTWLRRIGAVLFGKASGGGVAGSKKFRDSTDAVNRVDVVTDSNGNRTSASYDDTAT